MMKSSKSVSNDELNRYFAAPKTATVQVKPKTVAYFIAEPARIFVETLEV